jgi:replicative DNA helicase
MSEIKDNLAADLAMADLIEAKKAKLQADELELKEFKVKNQKQAMEEAKSNLERAANTSFGILPDEEVMKLIRDSEDYIDAAKNGMTFICAETFNGKIPFFRKNLIIIGAKTGEGKSTAVANIARQLISELNLQTGKVRRILVITNEEKREDFYNRITCLIKGWHYTNHDKFTEEQKKVFSQYIKLLSRVITVVDDSHGGGSGMTTTYEGVDMILTNCMRDGDLYDAVLIDYYQNVSSSMKDPRANEYECQARLASILDKHKNIYPAPIVVMAQIKPAEEGEEQNTPFEHRIKGRKQIIVPATFVLEMVAERKMYRTKWVIHKGRFSEGVGDSIMTGYDRGRFVPYDQAFKEKTLQILEAKNKEAMNKSAGANFMDIAQKEEKKDDSESK